MASSYFQPILEILDYAPSNLEFIPNVVITEGKNDYYFIHYFQTVIDKTKPAISIIPGTSSANLENIISLYLGWGRSFIVLLDSDKEGVKQKERYLELYGLSLESRIFTYSDIDPNWQNKELEQLIEHDDKINLQKQCYPATTQFNKKVFHRSIQELYLKQESFTFSATSTQNFNKILAFIREKLNEA